MNLTKTNWPGGWNPSQDSVNGSPDSLMRMDNLTQDEEGVVGLVKPSRQIPAVANITKIFSKYINNRDTLYLGDRAGGLTRLSNLGSTSIGAGDGNPCFGDALGKVLAISGTGRYKDDGGAVSTKPLGLSVPGKPIITIVNQPSLSLGGASGGVTDDVTLTFDGSGASASADTMQIGGGISPNPDDDIIQLQFTVDDPNAVTSLTVKFNLGGDDYYLYTWYNERAYKTFEAANPNFDPSVLTNLFPLGASTGLLTVKRSAFTRYGNDQSKNWRTVTSIAASWYTTSSITVAISNVTVFGGIQGVLNGTYQWVVIAVDQSGNIYQPRSPMSEPSDPTLLINGAATIFPSSIDGNATHYWVFRRAVNSDTASSTENANPVVGSLNIPVSYLSKFYLTGVGSVLDAAFKDTNSDDFVIKQGITLNSFLASLKSSGPGLSWQYVSDNILAIEGLFYERMLYMTANLILLSDTLNPDAIDLRYSLKPSGDPTELNLWLKKITNSVLILGTSKNLYEITGTLEALPDGTLDVRIIPIGENYPPLSEDCASTNGAIYYVAADGVRVTRGSNSTLVSPQLRFIFQNEDARSVKINPNNLERYGIAVGRTKLYVSIPCLDGKRQLLVYDILKDRWTRRDVPASVVHVTYKDHVLVSYAGLTYVDQLEASVTPYGYSGGPVTSQFPIWLETVYDSNGQPRNRKDTFTLKLVLNTGGRAVNVQIAKNGNAPWISLGNVSTTGSAVETKYFQLDDAAITLGFRYAIRIVDVNLLDLFELYEMTLEYDPRPEQVNYLRIPNTNQGSYARKRWTAFAFVVDSLGNNLTFTPYVDNVASTAKAFSTAVKLTHIHFFDTETVGSDMGGILSGGVFEFYGVNNEESVSEKLPTPTTYLVIPPNDYGVPNRKKHSSYKFQINTRGSNVRFTPVLDGVSYTTLTINTTVKKTVEYFFTDTYPTSIDIGGILESLTNPLLPFEFYGVIKPQDVEVLPPRLELFRIPNNNFGVAAPKRVRTIPIIIDTGGADVTFTPIVDGVETAPSTLNSVGKRTLWHFFQTDVFGVDFGGLLAGSSPFEFYSLGQLENVETLPVPKKYDQLGPVIFERYGKLFMIRLRIIANGSLARLPFQIYGDLNITSPTYGDPLYSGEFILTPGVDQTVEVQIRKNVNSNIFRLVLGPTTDSFHRYDVKLKVALSGQESDSKWIQVDESGIVARN